MNHCFERRSGAPARRRTWWRLAPIVALVAAPAVACGPPPHAACAPGAAPPNIPATSPWARTLCRQVSQKPPTTVNGIIYRDGVLWIASLQGRELVAADATTGEIIGRFGPDQGVDAAPDDLVMIDDGTIYWTGFASGEVGVLTPDGHSRQLVNVGAGVNPIAIGTGGALYVCRISAGKGLRRIDPATGAITMVNPDLAVNAFAFGPDGLLYAQTMDTVPSRLVRIDPDLGRATTVAPNVGATGAAVRFPPRIRGDAPTTAYVLSPLPATVLRLDVTTGRQAGSAIRMPFALGDNMTFAPDGRLFVTAFTQAMVGVVGIDGTVGTLAIGRR